MNSGSAYIVGEGGRGLGGCHGDDEVMRSGAGETFAALLRSWCDFGASVDAPVICVSFGTADGRLRLGAQGLRSRSRLRAVCVRLHPERRQQFFRDSSDKKDQPLFKGNIRLSKPC